LAAAKCRGVEGCVLYLGVVRSDQRWIMKWQGHQDPAISHYGTCSLAEIILLPH
jgi:hypothetical protein